MSAAEFATNDSHLSSRGIFCESPRTARYFRTLHCDVGELFQDYARHSAVHKEGQSFPNKTFGGASIKEPTEVFNHPRVGIHVNLWVGERLLWPFRRFEAL
jgi:hypothetical protein